MEKRPLLGRSIRDYKDLDYEEEDEEDLPVEDENDFYEKS